MLIRSLPRAARSWAATGCAVAIAAVVAVPVGARTVTPSRTATRTPTPIETLLPTCAATGTPYCADQCFPCPTVRENCLAVDCGFCVHNPTCSGDEICSPRGGGPPYGCCDCVTPTPAPTEPTESCEGTCGGQPCRVPESGAGGNCLVQPGGGCECVPEVTPTWTVNTSPTPTVAPSTCAGDCDANGRVAIHELVTCVDIALGLGNVRSCPACATAPDSLVQVSDLLRAVNNALVGCRTTSGSPTLTATPTRTCGSAPPPRSCGPGDQVVCGPDICAGCQCATPTPTVTRAPLVCEGCTPGDDSCAAVISGVTYTGTCGDGQISDGRCYRSCDWVIPPDACGGDACDTGRSCLTMWHGLVVGGGCHQCTCVFDPGTPTSTPTPTPTGWEPTTPTRTVPPALERAIAFVCGGSEYEHTFDAGESAYSGSCYGFEHRYAASMQQFSMPAGASNALDAVRERGTAVPFRGDDAIAWSELYGPERYDHYVWAHGCWLVHVLAEKNLGSPRFVGPLTLAQAIYAFGTEDDLFETCLPTPTASP